MGLKGGQCTASSQSSLSLLCKTLAPLSFHHALWTSQPVLVSPTAPHHQTSGWATTWERPAAAQLSCCKSPSGSRPSMCPVPLCASPDSWPFSVIRVLSSDPHRLPCQQMTSLSTSQKEIRMPSIASTAHPCLPPGGQSLLLAPRHARAALPPSQIPFPTWA